MTTNTRKWLADFVNAGSEAAFCELVACFTNLVYSTAIRLVNGDNQMAQDVTQTVFIDLARLARKLPTDVMLGGWLHRHTCFVAATLIRSERRRQARERQALDMNALSNQSQASLTPVIPILDDAINHLAAEDRTAVVLRFFEQSDFRSLGENLGINESAARMRVNRALEKLELLLKQRGVAFSATALGTALAAEAVSAAPAGLAAGCAAAALATAAGSSGATLTFLKLLIMTKLKAGILGAVLLAGVAAPLVIQHQANAKLRERDARLLEQTEQLAHLTAENTRLSNLVARASSPEGAEPLREVLKLRGEVGVLKRELASAQKVQRKPEAASQTTTNIDPEEQQKQTCLAKMNYSSAWMMAFFLYAEKNQDRFPTNLDQAISWFPEQAKGLTNVSSDQFQIVYQGSPNELTNPQSIIVLCEKEPWQTTDGGWVKTYSFADGHSEIHKAANGDFQEWERQHMIAPPEGSDSGK